MRQTRVIKHSYYVRQKPVNAKRGRPRGLPLLSSSVRLGAVHRSAAPWPPTGWPRSTLGAMGLSFRVRNGTGRAPHALAADRWAAPTVTVSGVSSRALGAAWRIGGVTRGHPRARTAHEREVPRAARCGSGRARAISAARLRASPPLHLPSIDQVVYLGPYRKEN